MAFVIDAQPIFDLINRPIGDSDITIGIVILAFIFFYIIAQYGGKKWS